MGDFAWVVRRRGGGDVEAVLDCVVERKRVDDLASSITDGRYREQKVCNVLKKRYYPPEVLIVRNLRSVKSRVPSFTYTLSLNELPFYYLYLRIST